MACITTKRYRDKETGQIREALVIDFYDQHGKRRLETLAEGTTKKRAKKRLREIEEMVGKKIYLPAKSIPLFKEVAKEWIDHKKNYLRANTWDVYGGHVKNHFHADEEKGNKIDLDSMRIDRIDIAKVEEFISDKQNVGMNLLTLRKVLVSLNQIFNYAVRHRYIEFNPLREAERPRSQGREGEHEQDKIRILTPEQIQSLLQAAGEDGQKYRMLYLMAILTGARQGELLGLKWSDFDWKSKQVHVQRTYTKGQFFSTKTKTSNRKIDLGPSLIQELKKWKLACPPNELDLVFPNEEGKPLNYSNMMDRHYLPTLRKAGIIPEVEKGKEEGAKGRRKAGKREKAGSIRFHDLRHSYASVMIAQGENLKYIQTQLGHSSPTVTLNVYAHLMKPTNQEAVSRLETTILGNGDFLETSEKAETKNG